ncbi:hypothetical protein [Magnetospirillum sp. SS-4]|uniref:hypothetical protein n=1 Tax=Magnetospirillum sp. SS-4 TaxID=2681465 RepID=UPI00137CDAEE|nr:hypothetical protein [Magnetospirillum sp. SS-4]CAA7613000.1 conserved exported hypothetical protein [Magnetospirillum sp. SS-4]
MPRRALPLAALILTAALSLAPAAVARDGHSHESGHGGQLTLDHGRKWQTDAPLRQGMSAIGADMAGALDRIHGNRFGPADYEALAGSIDAHIDGITRDCRLPPAADAQLHLVLAEIMDASEVMKGKGGTRDRSRGAVTVVKALDAYQAHFDHPGWRPLAH